MSDSNFQTAHQQFKSVLKAVDVDWMADCLSDDGTPPLRFFFCFFSDGLPRLSCCTNNLLFFFSLNSQRLISPPTLTFHKTMLTSMLVKQKQHERKNKNGRT